MNQIKLLNIVGAHPSSLSWLLILNVIGEYNRENSDIQLQEVLVHTGQHYDCEMFQVFFDELGLKSPDYHSGMGSGTNGGQSGRMRRKRVFSKGTVGFLILRGGNNNGTLVETCTTPGTFL